MGKSFIANCPKCGCGLMFSTGIFGKKKVKCACGTVVTIDEAMELIKKAESYEEAAEAERVSAPPRVKAPVDANDYTTRLSEEDLRELEGTLDEEWYLNLTDRRSQRELCADLERFYAHERFSGYYVMKNVRPESEYIGEDPRCKPVDFMFFKGSEPVLAVNVVPYTGISHMAIKNVRIACEEKGIKYLHFIVGYPNTEHYMVRKTLEELGEIRRAY